MSQSLSRFWLLMHVSKATTQPCMFHSAVHVPVGLIPAEPCGPDPGFVVDPVLVASDGMRSLMIDQLGMPVCHAIR
jgi:hypothetical protein